MRIGELAKRAGVSVQTVRYYERRGLLPEPDRTRSGYRAYDAGDLQRLEFVLRVKTLGFTLSEIAELLDLRVDPRRTADDVRRRAREKIADVDARMRDLRQIRRVLGRLVESCEARGGAPDECALVHALEAEDRT